MRILSPAFQNGQLIPGKYTQDGENISPPLVIEAVPQGAQSLVIIMEAIDADFNPIKTHWMIWNVSPNIGKIGENSIPMGACAGINDFWQVGYVGPCPPPGVKEMFSFSCFALDRALNVSLSITPFDLKKAVEQHLVTFDSLEGYYIRKL